MQTQASVGATIEVVVADDHPMMRDGLVAVINSQPDMKVVGEASTGREAVQMVCKLAPDVAVLDIQMPDFTGLDIVQEIKRNYSSAHKPVQVVMFTMFFKESFVLRALKAGALGFVTKASPSSEVVRAIRQVYCGSFYLSPDISDNVIKAFLENRTTQLSGSRYNLLSEREQEIFHLLVEGNSNRAIADLLSLSERTVEKHRANIMTKLEVHSFRELIRYAVEIGVLEPGQTEEDEE